MSVRTTDTSALIAASKQDIQRSQPIFENQANDRWFTTEEAAEYLRISSKCLLNLVSNGRVPYYKFGRRNRFLLSELRQLLLGKPRGGFNGN